MNRQGLRTQRAASFHPPQAEDSDVNSDPERAAAFDDRNAKGFGKMTKEAKCVKSCVESDETYGEEIKGFEDDLMEVADGTRNLAGVTPEAIEKAAEESMAKHNLSKDILEEVGHNCATKCSYEGAEGPNDKGILSAMSKAASMLNKEESQCMKKCAEGKSPVVKEIDDILEHDTMEGSRYLEDLEEEVEAIMDEADVTKDDLKSIFMDCAQECKLDV